MFNDNHENLWKFLLLMQHNKFLSNFYRELLNK